MGLLMPWPAISDDWPEDWPDEPAISGDRPEDWPDEPAISGDWPEDWPAEVEVMEIVDTLHQDLHQANALQMSEPSHGRRLSIPNVNYATICNGACWSQISTQLDI